MKVKGLDVGKSSTVTGPRAARSGAGVVVREGAAGTQAPKDEVALSASSRLVGMAGEAVANTPGVRMEVVGPLRDAVASGNYDVASLKVADRILRQVLQERRQLG